MIRLMTYNIRGCIGMDNQMSVERIAEVIRESHARVVCLQEVHTLRKVSHFTDQPIELARLLDMRVAFQVNYREGAGGLGNAILTTLEVEHTRSHILTSKGEQRGFLEVGLRAPEGAFTVLTTHLGLSGDERLNQAKEITEVMKTIKNPKLVCGDLNAEPKEEPILELINACGLTDADADGELTFDAGKPHKRIDYVLTDSAFSVMGTKVVKTTASDHLPLIADLSLL
ncbi:MAG: endonuclease/exonuclease/phosphatase family protein [Armatimonadota bacterium]